MLLKRSSLIVVIIIRYLNILTLRKRISFYLKILLKRVFEKDYKIRENL